jgi:hypothetical protein
VGETGGGARCVPHETARRPPCLPTTRAALITIRAGRALAAQRTSSRTSGPPPAYDTGASDSAANVERGEHAARLPAAR